MRVSIVSLAAAAALSAVAGPASAAGDPPLLTEPCSAAVDVTVLTPDQAPLEQCFGTDPVPQPEDPQPIPIP